MVGNSNLGKHLEELGKKENKLRCFREFDFFIMKFIRDLEVFGIEPDLNEDVFPTHLRVNRSVFSHLQVSAIFLTNV